MGETGYKCPSCGGWMPWEMLHHRPGQPEVPCVPCPSCADLRTRLERAEGALEAVLLFYAPGPWDTQRQIEWNNLTGWVGEATTKVLCDTVRAALEKKNG